MSQTKKKILVVEDEPLVAQDLAMILERGGYQVVGVANDGLTALEYLHSRKPELALLDINLSSTHSGFDIAEVIKEKYHIPFIFITAFSDKHTLEKAKSLLPDAYIIKPFKKKDVLVNVELAFHKFSVHDSSHYISLNVLNENLDKAISAKEYEICLDIVQGLSNDEISQKHYVSINTVKTHLKRIFQKLNLDSRTKLSGILLRK
jgi:DNA-binding NarL/FixJ family response regulator